MTDKELLELAAKAAGIDCEYDNGIMVEVFGSEEQPEAMYWNPLTDDGDALRLAVKLKFNIHFGYDWGTPVVNVNSYPVTLRDDPYAATRQAIVRAAAEIGRTL